MNLLLMTVIELEYRGFELTGMEPSPSSYAELLLPGEA